MFLDKCGHFADGFLIKTETYKLVLSYPSNRLRNIISL